MAKGILDAINNLEHEMVGEKYSYEALIDGSLIRWLNCGDILLVSIWSELSSDVTVFMLNRSTNPIVSAKILEIKGCQR